MTEAQIPVPQIQATRAHPGLEEQSFEDALREQLRKAPWLMVSIGLHVLIGLIMSQFMTGTVKVKKETLAIQAKMADEEIDPIEPEKPPEPEEQKPEETETEVDDPIVQEDVVETEEVADTTNDQPLSDAPFEGKGKNDVLGVGGGAGGRSGGKYGRRGGGKGGGKASQKAVDAGLEWLKRHQNEKGYWSADGFSQMCTTNKCDGEGEQMHSVGVTGLALLAFLGAGNTVNNGKYKNVVKKGLKYLVDIQDQETGCFGEVNSHQAFLYDHAIATLAVTEGYGLSKWPIPQGSGTEGRALHPAGAQPVQGVALRLSARWSERRFGHGLDGHGVEVRGRLRAAGRSRSDRWRQDVHRGDDGRELVAHRLHPKGWLFGARTGHERALAGAEDRGNDRGRDAGPRLHW
jgi:hypothetical protein